MNHLEYVSKWYEVITELNSETISIDILAVIQKKSLVLREIIKEKKPNAKNIITFGLTPEILNLANDYSITIIEPSLSAEKFASNIIKKLNVSIIIKRDIPSLKYDIVFGLNQYITYFKTNKEQQEHVSNVFKLLHSDGLYLSTIRDYKNININKFVDEVFTLHNYYIIETREWINKTNYSKTTMVITKFKNKSSKLTEIGPVKRKIIMFKELAQLCSANNGKKFQIHQSKIYKPMYSKGMQFIITSVKE